MKRVKLRRPSALSWRQYNGRGQDGTVGHGIQAAEGSLAGCDSAGIGGGGLAARRFFFKRPQIGTEDARPDEAPDGAWFDLHAVWWASFHAPGLNLPGFFLNDGDREHSSMCNWRPEGPAHVCAEARANLVFNRRRGFWLPDRRFIGILHAAAGEQRMSGRRLRAVSKSGGKRRGGGGRDQCSILFPATPEQNLPGGFDGGLGKIAVFRRHPRAGHEAADTHASKHRRRGPAETRMVKLLPRK